MEPVSLTEPVGQLIERLQSLPLEVHGVVAMALVAGLLLWAWGWRVLKPMTVVVSALAGAYAASLSAPSLGLMDVKIEAIVLAGFAFGALAGLLVYRSAMALGTGVVVAVAAPLVASVVLEVRPPEAGPLAQEDQFLEGVAIDDREAAVATSSPTPGPGGETRRVASEIHELMRHAAGMSRADESERDSAAGQDLVSSGSTPSAGESLAEEDISDAAARLQKFVRAAAAEAQVHWNKLPDQHRFVYGSTAIAGLAVGVMLGLVLPGRAAGAVTSLFGAAVWLPSFVWLSGAWAMPWRESLARLDARGWLIVWAVASVIGLALQWRGMRRAKRGRSTAEAA